MAAEKEQQTRRILKGPMGLFVDVACTLIPLMMIFYVLELYRHFDLLIMTEQYVGGFLGAVLFITFLVFPANKKSFTDHVPWYDYLLAVIGLFLGIYIVIYYPKVMFIITKTTPFRVVLGLMAVLLVLEAVRRVVGFTLAIIVLCFVLYAHFGYLLPGIFNTRGVPWNRLLWSLYISPNNLIGIALSVGAVVVLAFIFFGRFYFAAGGGQVMIDTALGFLGKYRGGPAKGAVIASSLFGSMSGSAVANVVTTGMFTIPLMKRTGYNPEFASAVEATASTGGQLMPPVLGIAAFLMAELLNISYATIALAAILPAIFFYLSVFVQIDLRAARTGLCGLDSHELPDLNKTLKAGWMMLVFPLAALAFFLFVMRFRPEESALYAAALVIFLSFLKKNTRLGFKKILNVLEETGMGVVEIGVACAGAGIILGVVGQTGIGFSLAQGFTAIGEQSLFLLLFLVAISSALLGMGLPVIASYAILAVIAAPALVKLGLDQLAVHLFVFYYGVLSFLTPPVCMAVYAAAGIGKANFLRTAARAVGLAIVAYIIPFLFVLKPAIILKGTSFEILVSIITCTVAILAISFGVEGYFLRKLGWVKRILLIGLSLLLFAPGWRSSVIGLLGIAVLTSLELRRSIIFSRKSIIS